MLCVLILYENVGTHSLKSIKFSWQFYLLSEFLPEIYWEGIAEGISNYPIRDFKSKRK